MVMFGWGASVFYHLRRPPDEAMHIYAVGKQWMWKFQHLEGQREINELHVPTGRPIKITVTSEDVLHSLYFPAFRTKIDAIPGPLHGAVVRGEQARDLSHLLRRVLRHETLGHDRLGDRDGAGGFQSWLAGGGEGIAGRARRGAVPAAGVQQLPPRFGPGPRAVAEGHFRQAGGAGRRLDGSSTRRTCASRFSTRRRRS